MKTLYQQLGVTPHASHTAIQQSYFRLKRKFDPKSDPLQRTETPSAEYLALQNAYRTLSNSELRAEYDKSLQVQILKAKTKKEQA
jgi:DnaJ-class molecular chaperone